MIPKLHQSHAAMLLPGFALLTSLVNGQGAASGGVKVTLDRYSGPATVSAVKFKLRVQVERKSDTQPLNVRVELPDKVGAFIVQAVEPSGTNFREPTVMGNIFVRK